MGHKYTQIMGQGLIYQIVIKSKEFDTHKLWDISTHKLWDISIHKLWDKV